MASPSTCLSFLDRLRDQDPEAWRRMNEIYAPLFQAWLRPHGIQSADILDMTQLALAIVLRRLPQFHHNGRTGAFRTWLRGIVANVLREHRRAADRKPVANETLLLELVDPASELNQKWEVEHDRYVLRGLMRLVEPEFARTTWEAFVGTALEGRKVDEVAAELRMTVNAVHIARSRVIARLRREAEGFLETL